MFAIKMWSFVKRLTISSPLSTPRDGMEAATLILVENTDANRT